MKSLLRPLWSRLSMYLPVLLMGLFALGTWWLVRSAPQMLGTGGPVLTRHEPDYFMRGFSFKSFDVTGRLRSEVSGAEARHYPDTAMLDIDRARVRSYNDQGQLTIATAKRALAKDDGTELQLLGQANVVREGVVTAAGAALPRLEFRGEFLHVFRQTERLVSHLPVELTRGADQFTAQTMDYDHQAGVLELRGRVRGVLAPRKAR